MNILLDTNTLVWLLNNKDGGSIGPKSRLLLENAETVYVSSISVLEIRIKTMLGKLESNDTLVDDIASAGLKNLGFNIVHADAIKYLPNLAKHDPFDRMLLAQAKTENLKFLTSDTVLLDLMLSYLVNVRK